MPRNHDFPSTEQLVSGITLDCRTTGDPDLLELRAVRLKLLTVPAHPNALRATARQIGDIEVLAELKGRAGWFRAGSLKSGFRTPWRAAEAALVQSYLARLAASRGLTHLLSACAVSSDRAGDARRTRTKAGRAGS